MHLTRVNEMSNPRGNLATLKPYVPKWKSGQTRTIRVPIALADRVLEFARTIDGSELIQEKSLVSELVAELIDLHENTPRNNFSMERKAKLKTVIERLRSLDTVVNTNDCYFERVSGSDWEGSSKNSSKA